MSPPGSAPGWVADSYEILERTRFGAMSPAWDLVEALVGSWADIQVGHRKVLDAIDAWVRAEPEAAGAYLRELECAGLWPLAPLPPLRLWSDGPGALL